MPFSRILAKNTNWLLAHVLALATFHAGYFLFEFFTAIGFLVKTGKISRRVGKANVDKINQVLTERHFQDRIIKNP